MPRWLTWLGVAAVSGAGVAGGVAIARALIRKGADPALVAAARSVVERHGTGVPLAVLTNRAYHQVRPSCPARLDPDDPSHADCVRVWLQLRSLIAAELPPPRIEGPDDTTLPSEGPAADLRRWLGSLTPQQRSGLREQIGAVHYDAIARAAAAGDDAKTVKALRALKAEIDQLAEEDPLEALRRYRALKSLLGDRFDELAQLAEKHQGLA